MRGDGGMGGLGVGKSPTRRDFLAQAGLAAGFAAMRPFPSPHPAIPPSLGRLKQSVSRWTYGSMSLPDLCRAARDIGLVGIDLLNRPDWQVVRDAGLTCSMAYAADRRQFIQN